MSENLCASCTSSIFCPTWTELKCVKRKVIFSSYGRPIPTECSDYKKRGKDFKEPVCHCDDCLKNESLADELEESEDE